MYSRWSQVRASLSSAPSLGLQSQSGVFGCVQLLTRTRISVEPLRQPSTPLAYLARSATSLVEHGDNLVATWSLDGSRIVIQVSSPHDNALLCLMNYVSDDVLVPRVSTG